MRGFLGPSLGLVAAAALLGCGSAAPATRTSRSASVTPAATTPAPPVGAGSSSAQSGCARSLRAFADESRVTPAERRAVESLIAALARDRAPGGCASRAVTLHASGPAVPGTPDPRCLAAAVYVGLLIGPYHPPVTAAVERAAQAANRSIEAGERRGSTFCMVR